MAAVMLQVIPSFYTSYSENILFFSANAIEIYIVSKQYCIAHRNDKMCFLLNCRYHIILKGNINELRRKLDAFCFNYQQVDCLYTLFKYHFNGKIVIKSGQLFLICRGQFNSNNETEEWRKCPASQKRDFRGKSTKNNCLSPSKKTKSTQASASVFTDRIEQNKKTKIELELIKIVDCFLDGHGNYTSNLVSFEIKSL